MNRAFAYRISPGLIRGTIYVLGMVPACLYFYAGINDHLGADPMKTLERALGLWALRFLVAGLAITPLMRVGGPNLIGYRRALGLLAFFYAALHLTVYMVLDQQLNLEAIWADIVRRPYITIGMLAFVILVPLAVTSNNAMVKRLGAKVWQRLHKLVYLAAAAGAVHFLLVVKSWPLEPIVYAALVAALLAFRLLPRRRRARSSRGGIMGIANRAATPSPRSRA